MDIKLAGEARNMPSGRVPAVRGCSALRRGVPACQGLKARPAFETLTLLFPPQLHRLFLCLSDFGFGNFYNSGEPLSTWCGSPHTQRPGGLLEGKEYEGPQLDIWVGACTWGMRGAGGAWCTRCM